MISPAFRYRDVERAVLNYCKSLNVSDLLQSEDEQESKLLELKHEIEGIDSESDQLKMRLSNLYDSIETTTERDVRVNLEKRAAERLREQKELNGRRLTLQADFEKLSRAEKDATASASEVARDRKGTCFGYSVLLGSLARAAGIPSRFRMGYVYVSGIWAGHAWVEVLVGDDWIPIDAAAYSPGPADAARFSAFTSSLEEGISTQIGALMQLYGNLDIQILWNTR